MKIELIRGCTCDGLYIDDKSVRELTDNERKEIKKKICKWIMSDDAHLGALLHILTKHFFNKYQCSDTPCECCGDFIETYKLEIKED